MQNLIQLKNKKGFTLIEMLVVILIIVILIAIAIPAVAGYRADANETADKGAAETIFNALEAASTKYMPSDPANLTGSSLVATPSANSVTSPVTLTVASSSMAGPYLEAVQEFLGTNVEGTFTFRITLSTGSVEWVTFRRDGAENNNSNIMLYHALDGVTGYLDDLGGTYISGTYAQP